MLCTYRLLPLHELTALRSPALDFEALFFYTFKLISKRSGEAGGEGVHGETGGAGEGGGEVGGDDEETAGFAEVEVAAGGFVALGEGFVGDEDYVAAACFGFSADFFFGG